MPLTVPTHPAAVLPLKLWRPHWFDGVALVLGSMAPDFGYAFDGVHLGLWRLGHSWLGLVVWSLPLTLAGCLLVRRAAPVVAAHVRGARDYAVLRAVRHPWWVTAASALIGATSHLLLDDLERLSPVVVHTGHVLGFVLLPVLLAVIGRHRLLIAWHGRAAELPARDRLFWPITAAVAATSAATMPFLPGHDLLHTSGVRALVAAGLGLLFAAAYVTRRQRVRPHPGRSRRPSGDSHR